MAPPIGVERERVPELVAGIWGHPLCARYVQKIAASGINKVFTADDVLGERLMRIGGLIHAEHMNPGTVICPIIKGTTALDWLLVVGRLALNATPYLWTEEIREAIRGLDVPRHVVSREVLPEPRSWHTFETGISVGGDLAWKGKTYVGHACDALLCFDTPQGFDALVFGEMKDADTGEARPSVVGGRIPYGRTFPDDFDEASGTRNHAAGVLMMLSFLNSPYIPKRHISASRGARREASRHDLDLDDVTFIVLRRPSSLKDTAAEERAVQWKHQWLVSGHLRAQWYPSERAHRVIWIAPYLKGPSDAPMLTHAYKVAR